METNNKNKEKLLLEISKLQESTQHFKTVVESCPAAIHIVDAEGTIIYWNRAAENIFGYSSDEILGKSHDILMPAWLGRRVKELTPRLMHEGITSLHNKPVQGVGIKKDGKEFPVEIAMSSWAIGDTIFFSAITHDLSPKKGLEQELLKARSELEQRIEERTAGLKRTSDFLENIVRTTGEALVVTDALGYIRMFNPKAEQMFGYSASEIIGQHFSQLGSESYRIGKNPPLIEQLLTAGFIENYHLDYRRKSGEIFPVEINIVLLKDSGGEMSGAVASIRDITERKRGETALSESQKRYYSLFNELTDAAFVADIATGTLIDANRQAEHLIGMPRSEIIGMHHSRLHPPELQDTYRTMFSNFARQTRALDADGAVITAAGKTVPVMISSTTFELNGRKLMFGLFRDLSEQKQSEKIIRLARFVIDNASEAILCANKEGDILFANREACGLFGHTAESVRSVHVCDLSTATPRAKWPKYWNSVRQAKHLTLDFPFRTRDNRDVYLQCLYNFFEFQGEEYLCVFLRDITAGKNAEEKLKQEIEDRKQIERELLARDKELDNKAHELEEVNNALKVLLQRTENSKRDIEDKILFNMNELVAPYIDKLKNSDLNERQNTYLNIIQANILNIISPFGQKLSVKYAGLTPSEMHIANLIKDGMASKEISEVMGLSSRTVDFHRKNIRKKLGINNQKANLRSLLLSM